MHRSLQKTDFHILLICHLQKGSQHLIFNLQQRDIYFLFGLQPTNRSNMFRSTIFRAARVVTTQMNSSAGKVATGVVLTTAGYAAFGANMTQPSICDADYTKLRKEIETMIDTDEEKREDGTSMAGSANSSALD